MVRLRHLARKTRKAAGAWLPSFPPRLLGLYLVVFMLICGLGLRPRMPAAVPAFGTGAGTESNQASPAVSFASRWLSFSDSTLKLILQNEIPLLALASQTGADLERESAARVLVDGIVYQLTGISVTQPVSFMASQIPFLADVGLRTHNAAPLPAEPPIKWPLPSGTGTATLPAEPVIRDTDPVHAKLPPADQPDIIIYHTHTTESYMPTSGKDFINDPKVNIVAVGNELAKALQARNIRVVHDATVHDLPGRLGAYQRAVPTVSALVKKYPSAKIVIDLHRDALPKEKVTATIGGKAAARVLLVVGTDKIYQHPQWTANYEFVSRLVSELDNTYPGLCRGIDLREDRFNQQYHPHAILLEVGSNESTLAEALQTARLMAGVLARFIQD